VTNSTNGTLASSFVQSFVDEDGTVYVLAASRQAEAYFEVAQAGASCRVAMGMRLDGGTFIRTV
jgi:hypothetical protein